ncbi:MAG: hypothetical protein F6K36_17710 [Symploca sp. SIO3C6]|nr:hypothetical protein [Symploca sp. SIO3C6]NET07265.1 hypothetical protein [Symploca sp. SIO2B6]
MASAPMLNMEARKTTTIKIVLIVAYFGQWPTWFPAFLQSCKYNPSIDWLFFTDCEIPDLSLNNVRFVPFTLEKFGVLASEKLGFKVELPFVYKICDFKPTFGVIFPDYIHDYDFWGHCDLDVVWGDIRNFINDNILSKYEIISARKEMICGHFSLFRNNIRINSIFTKVPYYQGQLQVPKTGGFDEAAMTNIVQALAKKGEVLVYWSDWLVNYANSDLIKLGNPLLPTNWSQWLAHCVNPSRDRLIGRLGRCVNDWYWESGKLYHKVDEIMYIHFMTWKKSLKECYFTYSDDPKSFYISYSHIGLSKSDRPALNSQISSLLAFAKTQWNYEVWQPVFGRVRQALRRLQLND